MAEQWWYAGGLTDTSFTAGPIDSGWEPQNFIYGAIVTLGGSAGTCTSISVRSIVGVGGPYNFKIGLYNSSLNLVGQGTSTMNNTAAWRDVAVSAAVSPGTYRVMVSGAAGQCFWYYNTSANGIADDVAHASAMPASLTSPTTETALLYAVRMYVVEAGGEGPPLELRLDEPELGSGEFE